jgi:hypothetical protein
MDGCRKPRALLGLFLSGISPTNRYIDPPWIMSSRNRDRGMNDFDPVTAAHLRLALLRLAFDRISDAAKPGGGAGAAFYSCRYTPHSYKRPAS